MEIDKSLLTGSTSMLILNLLAEGELYGYQMIKALAEKSNNVFSLKAGTLYPLLHGLTEQGLVTFCEKQAENGRVRKYYSITPKGNRALMDKKSQWNTFMSAVNRVLEGGEGFACAEIS